MENEVSRVVRSQFTKEFVYDVEVFESLLFLELCLYWDWESGRGEGVKCIGALGTQKMCGEKKGWWREFHRKEKRDGSTKIFISSLRKAISICGNSR